jgi:hypothetical protein
MNRLRGRQATGHCHRLSGAALVLLVSCSTNNDKESVATTHQAVTAPAQQQIALSFTLPAAASLNTVVVGASTSATLADRSQIFGDVVTNGGAADVGNDAKTGSLFVNGIATLHDRSQIFGDITARHLVKSASATVTGSTTQSDSPPPTTGVSWTVNVNSASLGDVSLEPGQVRNLVPGKYGHFDAKSGSTVTVHSGVYEVADFLLEPQARLVIDDSRGPVQIVVDHDFTYRGAIVAGSQPVAQVLFAVQGTNALVESPFVGALVAPKASVHFQAALPQGHRAFVYGGSVSLEADTKIASFPFDWTSVSSDFVPQPAQGCFVPVAASQPCPVRGTRTGIVLPKDVSPEDVALASSGVLDLASGARANAALVNVGHWETSIGSSASTGGIWSEATTSLGSSAHIAGNVLSHSTVSSGSQVQVSGSIIQNTPLAPTFAFLWLALFPVANGGPVTVASQSTNNLAPGDYGAVTVAAGATLSLAGGTYTFDSLSTAAGSMITTSAKGTPLIVHVRQGFVLNGRVTRTSDSNQGVLFTYLGRTAIALKQPFQGTLAAPFASIELGANSEPHRGAFFANSVTLDAGAVVVHDSFGSWAQLPTIEDTRRGPLPEIQTRTSNGPPPALSATPDSAQQFVNWLVQSTKADLPAARSALQQVQNKSAVTVNLVQQFTAIRATDATRATLILNAIGYLRTPAGESFLTSLVNEPLPIPASSSLEDAQKLRAVERYQTAAVYGLAFLHTSTADALLKSLMHNHPSVQIRAAAVRSFLFHNPDTDRASLAAQLNPSEAFFADRFENRSASTASTFDDRMSAYLAKHPN